MRRASLTYDLVPGFRENKLLLDYLAQRSPATRCLPPLLMGDDVLGPRVESLGDRSFPREVLADRLLSYNREMGAGEKSLSAVEDLRRGAMVVVTGQQPGLLGGPLFTVYKALSTCLLARHIERKGYGRTIPLFWSASEDHDLREANRLDLFEGDKPERLALDLEDRGSCLSDYEIDPLAPAFLDRVRDGLHHTEFTNDLLGRMKTWLRGGFGGWFSRMMHSLFREFGLVIVEPRLIRDLAAPFLEREIREPEATAAAIRHAGAENQAAGYPPSLTGEEGPSLFVIRNGIRDRIHHRDGQFHSRRGGKLEKEKLLADLAENPGLFSQGVAIRPVVQDGIFPVVATVAGPSEISYLAQLGGVYLHHGVNRPPILPRVSLTLIEGKVERVLDRLALSPEQALVLEKNQEQILASVPSEVDGFLDARAEIDERLARLEKSLPTDLRGIFPRMERRIRRELDRVQGKVEEEARKRQGIGEEQVARVRNGIIPAGKLQERVWGIVPLLNRYGPDLIDEIAESVELFSFEHQWLYLAHQPKATAGAKPSGG